MDPYHEGELEVQRRAGVAENAARVGRIIRSDIPEVAREFLSEQPFAVLAGADEGERVWATLVHGEPGFLTVSAENVLQIAARPGREDPLASRLDGEAELGVLVIDLATRRRMRINGHARPLGERGLEIAPREVYANCPKYIQQRAVQREGGIPGGAVIRVERGSELRELQTRRVAASDTFFIASRHAAAGADASHRGGDPGFVRVEAPDRLRFPDYAGNAMFNTLGNLAADPRAGLLFVDFDQGSTLQLTGCAAVDWSRDAATRFPGAERVVEFSIDAVVETVGVLPLRAQLLSRSPHNPR
jgi:predicted pyridoxine 5'-phosphate oxidase superfamily flavin-nucleotide-binding protein